MLLKGESILKWYHEMDIHIPLMLKAKRKSCGDILFQHLLMIWPNLGYSMDIHLQLFTHKST